MAKKEALGIQREAALSYAVIVHAAPDNFANIPDRYVSSGDDLPDGYGSGPDNPTLATGDAGARIACGVISR
jgi:superoxide dismutase, Cu-Zn family